MKKPDIMCYDFDGTLCNTLPDIVNSMNVVLVKNGFSSIPEAKVRSFIGSGISKLVERSVYYALAGDGHQPVKPEILKKVTLEMGEHYTHHLTDNSVLYDDTLDILDYFKDIPQVIVSNKPQKMVELMCAHYGILEYFDLIIGGDTLDVCKPDKQVWEYLKKKMALKEDVSGVMIGDSIPDLKFGKVAGFKAIAVSYGYNDLPALKEEGADLIIDSLTELKNIY
jgi:phosphoglycolate phosphatase